MVVLEKGNFYGEPGGDIYYYDGFSLYCPGTTNKLTPSAAPHIGLSSFHDLEVDIRKFQKVNPLEYTLAKTKSLNDLVTFLKEHSVDIK